MDEKAISTLSNRLMRRYPGVIVEVTLVDHTNQGRAYQGWHLSFQSCDPQVLVGHGLAVSVSSFDDSQFRDARRKSSCAGKSEFAGCSWYATGARTTVSQKYMIGFHVEERASDNPYRRDSALTKTMQTRVMRILKPFIRGTWKPQTA
jgi:hypothetical protein